MSVITGSTGLEGAFSRMALQQQAERKPSKPAPSNGQGLTVHVMTATEEQELSKHVTSMIETKRKIAAADEMIARGKAGQAEARKEIEQGRALQQQGIALQQQGIALQQQGKAQAEEAKAKIAQDTAQIVKGLEGMVAVLSKMKEIHKANSASVQKIDALREKIIQYKNNLPQDVAAQKVRMQELKQEALLLSQSLK
ncbi:MAG: hypothetical protein JSS12_09225 [Verrucomicrobia bacterium]|nr:hypothetical protein [Verrucomicrobiota bacterium]